MDIIVKAKQAFSFPCMLQLGYCYQQLLWFPSYLSICNDKFFINTEKTEELIQRTWKHKSDLYYLTVSVIVKSVQK